MRTAVRRALSGVLAGVAGLAFVFLLVSMGSAPLPVLLGLAGVGSLAVRPSDDPPLGLVVLGFLGLSCALVSLAFLVE